MVSEPDDYGNYQSWIEGGPSFYKKREWYIFVKAMAVVFRRRVKITSRHTPHISFNKK